MVRMIVFVSLLYICYQSDTIETNRNPNIFQDVIIPIQNNTLSLRDFIVTMPRMAHTQKLQSLYSMRDTTIARLSSSRSSDTQGFDVFNIKKPATQNHALVHTGQQLYRPSHAVINESCMSQFMPIHTQHMNYFSESRPKTIQPLMNNFNDKQSTAMQTGIAREYFTPKERTFDDRQKCFVSTQNNKPEQTSHASLKRPRRLPPSKTLSDINGKVKHLKGSLRQQSNANLTNILLDSNTDFISLITKTTLNKTRVEEHKMLDISYYMNVILKYDTLVTTDRLQLSNSKDKVNSIKDNWKTHASTFNCNRAIDKLKLVVLKRCAFTKTQMHGLDLSMLYKMGCPPVSQNFLIILLYIIRPHLLSDATKFTEMSCTIRLPPGNAFTIYSKTLFSYQCDADVYNIHINYPYYFDRHISNVQNMELVNNHILKLRYMLVFLYKTSDLIMNSCFVSCSIEPEKKIPFKRLDAYYITMQDHIDENWLNKAFLKIIYLYDSISLKHFHFVFILCKQEIEKTISTFLKTSIKESLTSLVPLDIISYNPSSLSTTLFKSPFTTKELLTFINPMMFCLSQFVESCNEIFTLFYICYFIKVEVRRTLYKICYFKHSFYPSQQSEICDVTINHFCFTSFASFRQIVFGLYTSYSVIQYVMFESFLTYKFSDDWYEKTISEVGGVVGHDETLTNKISFCLGGKTETRCYVSSLYYLTLRKIMMETKSVVFKQYLQQNIKIFESAIDELYKAKVNSCISFSHKPVLNSHWVSKIHSKLLELQASYRTSVLQIISFSGHPKDPNKSSQHEMNKCV